MNAVELRGLTKIYGNKRGVRGINLAVKRGEIFGFIGPNGAGKSTTIRMMLQLIAPTSGSLSLLGVPITGDHPELRRKIGYLPSEIRLYPDMSGQAALRFAAETHGVDLTRSAVLDYARRLQLDLSSSVKSYSLGNRKKLGILLSLVHEPELLILDEPTSGLDPLMQQQFFHIVKQANETRGMTVFFSTHVLTEVERMCDRVAIIRDGRLTTVSDVDGLTAAGGHLLDIRFSEPGDCRDRFGLTRLDEAARYDGSTHKLRIGGDRLREALRLLADLPIADVNVRRPTLEELFMHEYEDGEGKGDGDAV